MTQNYQPVKTQERVVLLDLLRGIALLGILMVNMPLMNAPFTTELGSMAIWTDPANEKAMWIIRFFFTGKFYVLFSLLFGIGFYYFLKKAEEAGKSVMSLFYKRLGWLLVMGILHVVLLWYGDILVFYALFGFVMTWFKKRSNTTLIVWGFVFLTIPILLTVVLVVLINFALTIPGEADAMKQGFAMAQAQLEALTQKTLTVYPEGSFAEIVRMRLTEYSNILGGVFFFFPNVLGIFLWGMVLARKGVLENLEKHKGFFRRLLFFSLPVAIAGNLMLAHYGSKSSYVEFTWDTVLYMIGLGYGGPAMTFVYISIIAHCYYKGYFAKLANAIAKTGRMALTNYLSQSLIATTLFFSYGFGLYGKVNIWQGMLLTLAIYVVQVIWSHYWLQHFRFGPMEWLWRTLTYGKKQKMRK